MQLGLSACLVTRPARRRHTSQPSRGHSCTYPALHRLQCEESHSPGVRSDMIGSAALRCPASQCQISRDSCTLGNAGYPPCPLHRSSTQLQLSLAFLASWVTQQGNRLQPQATAWLFTFSVNLQL